MKKKTILIMSRSSRIGGIYAECANNLKKQYGYDIVATKNFYYTGNIPQADSEKWKKTLVLNFS